MRPLRFFLATSLSGIMPDFNMRPSEEIKIKNKYLIKF